VNVLGTAGEPFENLLEHDWNTLEPKKETKKIPTFWPPKRKKWTSHECMLSLLIGKGTKLWDIVGAF